MATGSVHDEATNKALNLLKDLTANLDGWEFSSEVENVKLYNRQIEGEPLPIMRGDTLLPGHEFTPQQVASVATLPGCRVIWDDKYGISEIKTMYSRWSALFWASIKSPYPIYWRDLCATSLREISDDLCYVVMTSVIDEQVPEKSDHVRANLILSGWKFEKVEEGVRVTYVNQIDLAGYIPQFFLTSIQQQVPACAGKVVDYIQEFGFAPTTESCTAEFKVEEFDHKKKEYTAQLAGKGECSWLVSKKMYPSSFDIKIIGSGGNAPVEMDVQENGNTLVSVKEISGPTTVKITKA